MHVIRSLALVFAIAAPAVLVATGCPNDYPKCENDGQCKKNKDGKAINEYCLFGQCQQCAKDSHCGAGQKCSRGRCEKACVSDNQCGAGQMCEAQSCVPVQCSETKPCGGGMQCNNGRCAAPASTSTNTTGDNGALNCERKGTVRFDFNAADLRPDAREVLDTMAKCMAKNADWRLTIEGHADERGTTDFNLQLGDRRAGSVKEYLVRLGVDKARIKTISYGEEKPVDSSSSESAWSANRRGELVVQ
jgi:peptidoglycan-associated lipoprotein